MKFGQMKELRLVSVQPEIYALSCFRLLGMNICLFEHTDKEQHVSKKVDIIKMKSLLFSHKEARSLLATALKTY